MPINLAVKGSASHMHDPARRDAGPRRARHGWPVAHLITCRVMPAANIGEEPVPFLARLFGSRTNVHYTKGIVHFNRGQYDEAAVEFEQDVAVVRDTANADYELSRFYKAEAHSRLGLAKLRRGDVTGAEGEIRHALEISDQFPDLHYQLGVISERNGRLEEAETALRRALEINPEFAEARCFLGIVLIE